MAADTQKTVRDELAETIREAFKLAVGYKAEQLGNLERPERWEWCKWLEETGMSIACSLRIADEIMRDFPEDEWFLRAELDGDASFDNLWPHDCGYKDTPEVLEVIS